MTGAASGSSGLHSKPSEWLDAEDEKTVISQRRAASPGEFFQRMPLRELADLLQGRMLDHFAVEQLIGGGGMGAVFRGLDTRLDRVVAIKVIPVDKRDPAMLRRFRLEAQAAARLDHPNIARVFYVGEADQWDYIVFEFIDGVNIRDLVEMDGPLQLDDAVFYTRQIAEALQHAHDRDVVHRDIKPSNILVTASGTAKLVDMGLARDTSLERSTQDLTASGITLGTFDYISPEQARDPRVADVRSDLYSLGCSLFFMLTGNPPFPEGTALQKLLNHGSLPPPDPRGWRDDLPDELSEILMKLMAKRPADRYQKPNELINDLLLLAEMEGLPRSCGPTTIAIVPTVAQPTLLETYLPWLLAAGVLLGSTLWLQSQSISSGFALPSVQFSSGETESREVRNGQADTSSLPTRLHFDGYITQDSIRSGGSLTAALGEQSVKSMSESGRSEPGATNGGPLRSTTSLPTSAPHLVSPNNQSPASNVAGTFEATGRAPADSASLNTASVQKFPEPTFALPNASEPTLTGGSLLELNSAISATSPSVPQLSSIPSQTSNSVRSSPEDSQYADSGILSDGISTSFRSVPLAVEHPIIVVSNTPPADVQMQHWESSLHRAVQRLADQPGLGVIEIRGSVWLDRPLTIGRRPMGTIRASHEYPVAGGLLIRGGQDSDAKIEIARGVWNNLASGQGVVRVIDSGLTLQNIQIQAVLNGTQAMARSIIQIQGSSTLEVAGCTLTIQRDQSATTHFIKLGEAERDLSLTASSQTNDVRSVKITVDGCFVRGDCSMLQLTQNDFSLKDSVQISISNSLVAIKGRVLDLQSATSQSGVERIVRMFCQWSTFLSSDGFARLEYSGPDLPLVGFSRTAQSCVFWSRPTIPHVTVVGESARPADHPDMLFFQGANNAYDPQVTTFCQTEQNSYRIKVYSYREAIQEGWLVERGNERAISWAKPLQLNLGFHSTEVSDFALTPTHFVPGFQSPSNPRTGDLP